MNERKAAMEKIKKLIPRVKENLIKFSRTEFLKELESDGSFERLLKLMSKLLEEIPEAKGLYDEFETSRLESLSWLGDAEDTYDPKWASEIMDILEE